MRHRAKVNTNMVRKENITSNFTTVGQGDKLAHLCNDTGDMSVIQHTLVGRPTIELWTISTSYSLLPSHLMVDVPPTLSFPLAPHLTRPTYLFHPMPSSSPLDFLHTPSLNGSLSSLSCLSSHSLLPMAVPYRDIRDTSPPFLSLMHDLLLHHLIPLM
jgi:hypothetical protein